VAVVLALPASLELARKLGAHLGLDVREPELRRFPDGEIYVRLPPEVAGERVILVGSLYPAPAEQFMTVALAAATARDLGAQEVGLVAPYLAFMRQDVRFKPGEGVTSAYFAKLMSSAVDWMVTVDPHLHRVAALDGLYAIPTSIARAAPAIARWVADEIRDPVLVGPDAESAQWVSAVAAACGAPYVVLEKTRRGDRDVSITPPPLEVVSGQLTPVVIDDIVSTGKTMVEATRRLVGAGSAPPTCVAIHAVLADSVGDELRSAGATRIVTCNTIAHESNEICIAAALAEATRRHL
jgi:ribose-phosphate pyrophosphokinase